MAIWPYGTSEWARARDSVLGSGVGCAVGGCGRPADTVDHWPVPLAAIRDGRFPRSLAFDPGNLRPACRRCNSRLGAVLGNRRRGRSVSRQTRRW
ncbi:MAG TPA: hypothetical protein VFV36_00255 [Candidatus Methylomirabilis sp.]|nr:hypothetical protein [Candidatus Methylomirabilis sp.]